MDAGRRERLKALLVEGEALDPSARTAWLAGLRAGDPTLAADLETLLDATIRPEMRGEGLAQALNAALTDVVADTSGLPRDLGPYRLIEVIGHGGMGVVYRAEQTSPFRREVAVKALRGGWRPDELRARVAAERRALALMEHPGIARLYDAIVDEHDTPYLVMELVRGEPITDHVRAHRPVMRATLELFVTACRAVQHAHQRGIIHRDLKPSNLMVTQVDGRAIAKVIDFGVARLTTEDGAHSRLTRDGQVVGTLDYMSPEQAAGRTTEADTRSDVYSLGVVLYELLSGARPRELAQLPAHEALRRIAESPVRPLRQAAPERAIAADLEAIVHKALERDPARRYDGPGALADDLERFLRNEPVTARPPSAAYELRMLVRRHRVPVLAGAAAFVILAVFGVSMAILYDGQRRERERATAEARRAATINRFLQSMLQSPNPRVDGPRMTIREALDRNLARFVPELGSQPELLTEVETTVGTTYLGLGLYAQAESLLRVALGRHRLNHGSEHSAEARILVPLGKTLRSLAVREPAESLLWRALRLDAAGATPDTALRVAALEELAHVLRLQYGPIARVESLLVEGMRLCRLSGTQRSEQFLFLQVGLSNYHWAAGRWSESEKLLREALEIASHTVGDRHPSRLSLLNNLGLALRLQGRLHEAEEPLRACFDRRREVLGDRHADVGFAAGNLSLVLMDQGRFAEADTMVRLVEQLFARDFGPTHRQSTFPLYMRALLHLSRDRAAESARTMRRAMDIYARENLAEGPDAIYPREFLGFALTELGLARQAEEPCRKALELSLRHRGWDTPRTARAMHDHAEVQLALGRTDSALVWLRAARDICVRMNPGDPLLPVTESTIALCEAELQGRSRAAALEPHREALLGTTAEIFLKRRALRRITRHLESAGERDVAAPYREALAALPR